MNYDLIKVLKNVGVFEEDNIDDPDGDLDAVNGTVQSPFKDTENIDFESVDNKAPLENMKTLSEVKIDSKDNDFENQNVITLDEEKSDINIPKLKSESSEVTEIYDEDNSGVEFLQQHI